LFQHYFLKNFKLKTKTLPIKAGIAKFINHNNKEEATIAAESVVIVVKKYTAVAPLTAISVI
jgi:hypothetical protein